MYINPTLQDKFLHGLAKKNAPVIVYLKTGKKLIGTLAGINSETFFLKENRMQVIYKSMVNSLSLQSSSTRLPRF